MILSWTSVLEATELADKIRQRMEEFPIPIKDHQKIHSTISIGVASFPDHGEVFVKLLDKADAAIYAAKDAGRNCVCLARCRKQVS